VAEILILGLGNSIMGDDGVGVHALERLLERYALPAKVEAREGGTLGLHLAPYLAGVRALLLIDAIQAAAAPGTLIRSEGAELTAHLGHKLSLHQVGLSELLAVGSTLGAMPERIVLWGVVAAVIAPGLELTPVVAASLEPLVEQIVAELHNWGVMPIARN
jgi:hydrogenase maturation protease